MVGWKEDIIDDKRKLCKFNKYVSEGVSEDESEDREIDLRQYSLFSFRLTSYWSMTKDPGPFPQAHEIFLAPLYEFRQFR